MFIKFFFFRQKTAYDMRISDLSSDVCSSDLGEARRENNAQAALHREVHRFAGCFAELLQIWRCPADQFVGLNVMAAQGQRSGGEFETPGLRVLGQIAEPGQGMRETLSGALAHSVERGNLCKAQGSLAAAECV